MCIINNSPILYSIFIVLMNSGVYFFKKSYICNQILVYIFDNLKKSYFHSVLQRREIFQSSVGDVR